jgi:hypothetical protein
MNKLTKPYTSKQRADFIVEYNHNKGLTIEETDKALYALEAWEKLEGDTVVDNTEDYEKEQEQKRKEHIQALTCTKRDFALILQKYGISYSQLKELIATNDNAQLEWDLCTGLLRSNPLIDLMASQLGITSDQIDNLFLYVNGEITEEVLASMITETETEEPVVQDNSDIEIEE